MMETQCRLNRNSFDGIQRVETQEKRGQDVRKIIPN